MINLIIIFIKKYKMAFLKLSKKNKKKYLIINSNLDKNENKRLIINQINKLI